MIHAKITGCGHYVPPKIVKNSDLEKLMDTSNEWIRQRSGIEERRFAEDDVGPADLGFEASKMALKKAGITAQDIDYVLFATLSPDHHFPGSSVFLHELRELDTTPSMDIRCQCSGFIYSISVAHQAIMSGQYKKILVVGAEVQSKMMDLQTRSRDVAVLFGDGAGAAVVEACEEPTGGNILATVLHSQGKNAKKLWCPNPGTKTLPWIPLEKENQLAHMDGRFVFKNAVVRLEQVVNEALEKAEVGIGDIDHFFFHQANLRINEFVAHKMKLDPKKVYSNIQKYGNCSAASIPILLSETSSKIKKGDLVCLAAFGSGFTWGASIIRW